MLTFRRHSALLLLVLVAVSLAGKTKVDIKRKRELTEGEDGTITRLKRSIKIRSWDKKNGVGVTIQASEKVDSKGPDGDKTKIQDKSFGAIAFRKDKLPSIWIARSTKTKTVDVDETVIDGDVSKIVEVDQTKTASLAGIGFIQLAEYDPQDAVVGTPVSFVPGTTGHLEYDLEGKVESKDGLHFVHLVGTATNRSPQSALELRLTFIIAEDPVVLDVDGLQVSAGPNKFKTIFGWAGWDLASPANHLRLDLAVGLGGYTKSKGFNSSSMLRSDDGMGFDSQGFASYGAERRTGVATLSGFDTERALGDADVDKADFKLRGRYGASAVIRKVSVDFAANATEGVYDPAIVADAEASSDGSAASAQPMLAALVGLAIALQW